MIPLRVLLLTDEYQRRDSIGGGDVMTKQIVVGLTSRGHSVGVCYNWGGQVERETKGNPKEFRVLCPKRVWKPFGFLGFYICLFADRCGIKVSLSRFRPDVIYCLHQRGIAVPTISFVNRLGVPVVYRVGDEWLKLHYYAEKYNVGRYWLDGNHRFFYRFAISTLSRLVGGNVGLFSRPDFVARFVVFNSVDLARRSAPFIKGNCQMRVIKNGVDLNLFRFRLRNQRKPPRLLYVGRLVGHKGIHILPEMMMQLNSTKSFQGATLTIVGWSDNFVYIEKLKKKVLELGLSSTIRLAGVVPHTEIPRYYDKHDILVFPTPVRPAKYTVEGCPSVLVEAMACGLPIVARMNPGVDETVRDGKTCVGVYEDTAEAFAQAVTKLHLDDELYGRLSKTGRHRVETEHSLTSMLDKTEELLSWSVSDS